MKLLIVSHASASAINQQLYAEIQRQTVWDLTLVTPRAWRDEFGNRLDEPDSPGSNAKVLKVRVWMNGSIILHTYRLRWRCFLDRGRFDAIYVNHEPYALATAQICFANSRAERPATMGFYSCQNIAKRYPPPFAWLERMVYRQSRFAFPITRAVAEVLELKGFEGDIAVSPLPIDSTLYRPYSPGDRPDRMPRANGKVMLGYVGRLVEAKGLRTLALALGRILDLNWHLVVIGSGPFQPEFDRLLTGGGLHERVTHLGFVAHQETPKYLAAMDILVLPSETQPNWKEQFGRVIPEALACGAAVVGSSSGEIPRLLRESGGGIEFRERDVVALAEALKEMISSPERRKEMAGRGRRWVMAHLSIPTVAAGMAAVIKRNTGARQKPDAATNT